MYHYMYVKTIKILKMCTCYMYLCIKYHNF
jgi:hypothetical protein